MSVINALDENELTALIARCAQRDKQALKILYDRCAGYFNAIAFRIVRSHDASNDVLQEAFLQIWHHAESYRSEQARALTWMSSIVRYRAIDRREHDQRLQQHHSWSAADDERVESETATPEFHTINAQMHAQLLVCLAQLNAHVQQCIRWAYLDGCSRDEIATRLNTNSNTVKSWLYRGAEALKLCLSANQAPTS